METDYSSLWLGTILCKHCKTVIGMFDSEQSTTYYSDCQEPDCLKARLKTELPKT